jgi:hypothetical protein
MNPELSLDLAQQHVREMQREATQCSAPGPEPAAGPSLVRALPSQLRSRIGFALVEAGLRLLTDSPATAAPPGLD